MTKVTFNGIEDANFEEGTITLDIPILSRDDIHGRLNSLNLDLSPAQMVEVVEELFNHQIMNYLITRRVE